MSRRVTINPDVRRATFEYPDPTWSNNKDSQGNYYLGYAPGDSYKQTPQERKDNEKNEQQNMTEDRKASLRAAAMQRQDFLQGQACKNGRFCSWQGGGKVAKKTKRKRSRRTKKSRSYRKK